jgi:geranylgeranyl pyrophosphate synthase
MATLASPGVLLTAGAGLLSLAHVAVTRAREDGGDDATAVALVEILGSGFALAANGQTANLEPSSGQVNALTAYRQAAAKSGPLGSLIARLGARTATSSAEIIDLLGDFGQCLGVRSQLLNDARDAAPDAAVQKADVRAGARTVPLAFTHSTGAPLDLSDDELIRWEQSERSRIAAGGGLAAAYALAEAERLGAVASLDSLAARGHAVNGLRALL